MTNIHPTTGIRYGYISAASLDDEVVHELMYGAQAKNLSEDAAIAEETIRQQGVFDEALDTAAQYTDEQGLVEQLRSTFTPDLDDFESSVDEPIVEGCYEHVHYRSSWLGGALHFFILESPCTAEFVTCSPCVPGAADLNNPQADGVVGYDVPPEWRRKGEE